MACIVLLPLYKNYSALSAAEILSLNQIFRTLQKHPIGFVVPKDLSMDAYKECAKIYNCTIHIFEFQNNYFLNVSGYNKLLINPVFYKYFCNFDFVLIYQLDAFVFRDELDYWCNLKYDYIGAPWTGLHDYMGAPLIGVGNGGFSLRNVHSMLVLLKKLRMLEILQQYQSFNWKGMFPRLPKLIIKLMKPKKIESAFQKNYTFQEDVFWCKDAPAQLKDFKANSIVVNILGKIFLKMVFRIPSVEVAAQFSMETRPSLLYQKNNCVLPFGCHAWEKYEPLFWEPFISGKAEEKSHE